jgi:hypothetical protein
MTLEILISLFLFHFTQKGEIQKSDTSVSIFGYKKALRMRAKISTK